MRVDLDAWLSHGVFSGRSCRPRPPLQLRIATSWSRSQVRSRRGGGPDVSNIHGAFTQVSRSTCADLGRRFADPGTQRRFLRVPLLQLWHRASERGAGAFRSNRERSVRRLEHSIPGCPGDNRRVHAGRGLRRADPRDPGVVDPGSRYRTSRVDRGWHPVFCGGFRLVPNRRSVARRRALTVGQHTFRFPAHPHPGTMP